MHEKPHTRSMGDRSSPPVLRQNVAKSLLRVHANTGKNIIVGSVVPSRNTAIEGTSLGAIGLDTKLALLAHANHTT